VATNPPVHVKIKPPPVVAAVVNPPPVTPPTPPEPSKIGEPPPAAAAVGFPELMLQGISVGKKKTFAIVNGKTLLLGDRIEGALLVKISTDSVTFDKAGTKRELFLLR
jgi:type II secretory pathway component PulC